MVVGGSLGGLLAGNILHRAGFDVTVHERIAVPLDGRGAGIAAHPELFDAFERAGVNVNDAIGTVLSELPITPERVFRAVRAKKNGSNGH